MNKVKGTKGITLVALVITIIILLILAGITITQLIGNGIFTKTKQAKMVTDYRSAKEIIEIKLMEIQTECIMNEKEYSIVEIAKSMKKATNITIEKYYNSNTASIKKGTTENLIKLKGIVISVNQYPEYKFLIGESCKIEGIAIEDIPDTIENFKTIEKFEEEIFGGKLTITGGKDKKPENTTVDIPSLGEDVDVSSPIEITTYMSVKSNTTNTLNLIEIEEAKYVVDSKTENVNLENNILIANDKADSYDICKIIITGTYKGQKYKNNLTVFVEPQNRTTVQDKDGNTKEAFAIYTEQDLIRMQEIVTTGANNKCNAKVMNDIKLNESLYEFDEDGKIIFKETAKKYKAIGSGEYPYLGIFEGNGKTISGLYIKLEENEKVAGLFGVTRQGAEINNITLKDSYVYGYRIGGIAGYNEGRIYRCKVKETTIETSSSWAGGIVCTNNGEIIECIVSGYLYGRDIGGIAGQNGTNDSGNGFTHNSTIGKIYRCYTSGYIGYNEISGIVSHNGVYGGEGYIYDCCSIANLEDNYHSGTIAAAQSSNGVGYIYNSYYLNLNCNFSGVVTPEFYGNVSNSYSNDTTITANILNSEENEEIWINDIKDENGNWKYNNGSPILKWQTE